MGGQRSRQLRAVRLWLPDIHSGKEKTGEDREVEKQQERGKDKEAGAVLPR